jgi:hypothetical protein
VDRDPLRRHFCVIGCSSNSVFHSGTGYHSYWGRTELSLFKRTGLMESTCPPAFLSTEAPACYLEVVVGTTSYALPINRRSSPRHKLKLPIRVRVGQMSSDERVGESENISLRGVFLYTGLRLTEGTTVHLLMEMPEQVTKVPTALWICTGRVVRVKSEELNENEFGIAVQFDFYEVCRSARLHWAIGAGIRGPVIPRIA